MVALPGGLQYKVIKVGTWDAPKLDDTVITHYRGTLIRGKEFDSSYRHRGPVPFQVKQVILEWTEALRLMKVGVKWQLFVPPHLTYGPHGHGREVGSNATLIFEIELITIQCLVPAKTGIVSQRWQLGLSKSFKFGREDLTPSFISVKTFVST